MVEKRMIRFLLVFSIIISVSIGFVKSHNDGGEWSCNSDSEIRIEADFRPGIITLDGHPDDWNDVDGFEFSLLPALDPHEDDAYEAGKMTVKALHDGNDVFFMLQVDSPYAYSKGENTKCPSVALMFQVGENASYHNMGGCKESPDSCSRKTCRGHEVDIMHFSIGNAIPGRLYGGNPIDNREGNGGDRFGHLVDLYTWNPHCRYLDGISPSGNDSSAQNDWKGAWWHDSFQVLSGFVEEDSPYSSVGQNGKYYFEFSRPLRTMDRLQQDVQFSIGQSSNMAVAFWYPIDGKPWHGSGHYSVSCDWLPLDVSLGSSVVTKAASRSSGWDAASAFSLLLSVAAFCLSVFVGYYVSKNKSIPFTPMDHL
ncbi:Cytochrome c-552/DMSO reductase-like [Macleaya cordata]|uniref:Cytochrome c-552/DMSO reductase-like n=1 Tax=Macleaya cordata TaxID=56857 RepID=A0A200R241_MACCD|nr:Cytochrome c-552/DMSO reductase-like [Macleaya cordata]